MVEVPARIHLLPARNVPKVVVIRRKPSKLVHVMVWNTATDEIEHGSWFCGRLYEMRSDVSFDGEWMVYLAMGDAGQTWTGICRPPYLKTVVHWENFGTWNGGGVFLRPNELWLNLGYAKTNMEEALRKTEPNLPFSVADLISPYGEDEGVLYPRFERDGFHRVGPLGREELEHPYSLRCVDDPGWVAKPTESHPRLRVRYTGYLSNRGRVFQFDLPDHPDVLDSEVAWAAYDALGQLVFARRGLLFRYTLEGIARNEPSAVIDLESLERSIRTPRPFPEPPPPPAPIRAVVGDLADQDVMSLIIPAARVPWADKVRDLAGEFMIADLAELDTSRTVLRTPAYYLRQHDLVHVREPESSAGEGVLEEVCSEAFAAIASGTGTSVALRPIGLATGWDFGTALRATLAAARDYVAGYESRAVLLVAEDEEERSRMEALL